VLTPVTAIGSCAPELSVSVTVLVKVPYAVGLNVTVMVQVAPAARLVPHVVFLVNEGSPAMATEPRPTAAPPVFETVTLLLGLSPIVPENVSVEVDRLNAPGELLTLLVPLRETFCAPLERLIVSVPVRVPAAVGENVTVIVQLFPAAIDDVQVVVAAKSPLVVTPLFVTAAVPLFLTVTVMPALVVPVACCGNVRLVGETVIEPPVLVPLPLRVTTCGLFSAESVNVSVPLTDPVAVGVKVTSAVHVAPAATLAPHVVLATVKGVVAAMLLKLIAAAA
jgi:hypothetical protein